MIVIDAVAFTIGVVGILFAFRCYRELWKWARQCQHARIAIAYKRRVQLQAPIVEWVQWANQLNADQKSHGRVVYRNGGVTVAIAKAVIPPGRTRSAIRRARGKRVTEAPQNGAVKA